MYHADPGALIQGDGRESCYTDCMRSVADDLREETRRRMAALSPTARIRLALELGDADVTTISNARRLSHSEARAAIARSRRLGRRPSRAHDG